MQAMERTVNPYATFGPAETPGVSWHEYFTELKKRNLARKNLGGYKLVIDENGMEVVVEDDDDDEPEFVVTEEGHIIPPEEYTATLKGLRERLLPLDWEVTVKRSRTAHEPLLYKGDKEGDHNRGDVRTAAHDQLHFAMLGVRYNEDGDQMVIGFQANWDQPQRLDPKGKMASPKFDGAVTFDPILGREWRTRYLAPRKPDQWREGQRVLAMAFVPWLDVVAPKPGAKIKKTQTSVDLLNGEEWNG